MTLCYKCENELNELNSSDEHIILNACGGKLSSKDLLCKICNNEFGSTSDAALARQTKVLSHLLQVKRDRNKTPDIRGKSTTTGEGIVITKKGDIRKAKPTINIQQTGDQILLNVNANNWKEVSQIVVGLKRKYPNFPEKDFYKAAKEQKGYLNDSVSFEEQVGGDEAFRAVTKAAVSFYIFKGGDRKIIKHLLPYLTGEIQLTAAILHFLPLSIYDFDEDEVSHIIKLFGNPQEKILYCYIEYFNAQCYLVKLNDAYDGPPIDETYIYDVVHNQTLDKAVRVNYDRKLFESIFNSQEFISFEYPRIRYERTVLIATRRSDSEHIKDISKKALEETLKQFPGATIFTEEILKRYSETVVRKMMPFIVHKQKGRRTVQGNRKPRIPPQ
jgi:hypothetical protein